MRPTRCAAADRRLLQALAAVTIDAAWQLRMDHEVGSIEASKRADFTVVDGDPLAAEAPPLDVLAITGTWFDGEPDGPG